MAIVKKVETRKNASNEYMVNRNQNLLTFNPDGDIIWVNGEAYDYNTLSPIFDKKIGVLGYKSADTLNSLVNGMILSNKRMMTSGLTNSISENGGNTFHYQSSWNGNRFNLDSESSNFGSVIRFVSDGNVPYNFIWFLVKGSSNSTINSSYSSARSSANQFAHSRLYYILVQGDDFSNAGTYVTGEIAGTTSGFTTTPISGAVILPSTVIPVAIDVTNKFIYCHQTCVITTLSASYTTASSGYLYQSFGKQVGMIKIPFTLSEDSVLAVGSVSGNAIVNNSAFGSMHSFDNSATYYMGLNTNGSPMFMTQCENDVNPGISSVATTVYNSRKSLWTASKTNLAPKIYFDTLSGGVKTNVVALNLSSNQFSGNGSGKTMYRFAPSKFIKSTVGAEVSGNIFYSFSLCFDTSSVPGFIYYKWDKDTPSNTTANLVTIDWDGENYSDHLVFPYPTEIFSYLPEIICAECFVTYKYNKYYLNVLNHCGNDEGVAAIANTNARKLVTFEIDQSNWTSVTFKSSILVDAFSFMPLNSDNTEICVLRSGGCDIYHITNGVWNLAYSESGSITGVAKDDLNRLWALDVINSDFSSYVTKTQFFGSEVYSDIDVNVRVLLNGLTNTVSVVLNDRDISYAGSNVSSSCTVNVYDENDARVATSVILLLNTQNCVFTSNGSNQLIVNTSSSADTVVGLTITGSGLVSISAGYNV